MRIRTGPARRALLLIMAPMTTAHEPSDPSFVPDAVRKDAHAWVSRLSSGHVTQSDAQALRRWLDISPQHQAAFGQARDQWRVLRPALGRVLEADAAVAARHRRAMGAPRPGRRWFLGGAASALAAAGMAAVYSPLGLWPAASEWGADYRTATGEQRDLALSDRVSVAMNTRTSLRQVSQDGHVVGLDLLAGEAAITLQPAKRFVVTAGDGRSTAESGGRFEVRYVNGKVCVTCVDGAVRVEHRAGTRLLQSNQQAIYDDRALSGIADVDPHDVLAWQRGELVFKRAPLAAVVDEINRYRPGRVVLLASSTPGSTVSARFRIAELDTALAQIERTFGLRARALPGDVLLLS